MLLSTLLKNYETHETSMGRLAKSTLSNYVHLDREFLRWIDGEVKAPSTVADFTTYRFMCYIAEISKRVPKKAPMVRAAVRSFCKYLIVAKWVNADITAGIELPKVKSEVRTAPDDEIVLSLLQAVERIDANQHKRQVFKAILYLLVFCGLRRKEVSDLRVEDIHVNERRIFVRLGKGNHSRYVTPPGEFWPVIETYLAHRPPNPSERLLVYSERLAVAPTAIPIIFRKILLAAGLAGQKITPHNMRHSFATRAARNHAPLNVIQAQLGHSRVTTTADYVHAPTHIKTVEAQYFGFGSQPPTVPPAHPVALPQQSAAPAVVKGKQKPGQRPNVRSAAPGRVRVDLRKPPAQEKKPVRTMRRTA